MSKKTTRRKNATFTLEQDGFSIHTFELSIKIDGEHYAEIKDELYTKKHLGKMYKIRKGLHFCGYFQKQGVRLKLQHINKEKVNQYFIRLIVNPRKLIDSESTYMGIFEPEKRNIILLEEAFHELFQDTPVCNYINAYKLTRLDLCTNIHCDKKSIFRETVRVLRKLPTPPKSKRIYHKEEDRKKENIYNKHYIKFACGTHSLVIYDKTYQTQSEDLCTDYEDYSGGILRFEVQCNRSYIRNCEKKLSTKDTLALLWHFTKNSKEYMIKHFSQNFAEVNFYHYDEAVKKITNSKYSDDIKKQQRTLIKSLQRKQSVDMALADLALSEKEKKSLLKSFKTLGFSPIPLRENFTGEFLIGPVSMLKMIGEEDVVVGFVETKWR